MTTVEAYNPQSDTWATFASMPFALESGRGAVVNGILYVIGGYNTNYSRLATVEVFTPPAPLLNIGSAQGQIALYWPAVATNYVLQATTNLSSTNWVAVTNGTTLTGVILTNGSNAFFRLQPLP